MTPRRTLLMSVLASVTAMLPVVEPGAIRAAPPCQASCASLVASGLAGGSGSTVGPGGALFVAEPLAGRIVRIDPATGHVSTFAGGLPLQLPWVGVGGVMDVAFQGSTAFALVTLVGPDVGGDDVVGLYRMDGPSDWSVVADIGAWALDNPPAPAFFVPTGVQYALEATRGGFLVTDGHHNRVLRIGPDGSISEAITYGNVVPTGLEVWGDTVFVAQAGPVPHLPATGVVHAVEWRNGHDHVVASGAPLLVDVERGRGTRLYALAQGTFQVGHPEGSPAIPDTGSLVQVSSDGSFVTLADHIDRPTSLDVVGDTAYVVTLDGEVWSVTGLP